MKRPVLFVLLAFLMVGQILAQAAKAPDSWARLGFLAGEWEGVGTGAPGEAVGGTSFAFDLDKKILVRKNWATYPPQPGQKTGLFHQDLMIIYRSPGETFFRAVYFDNEDHVINYLVSFPEKPNAAAFETGPEQKGPRFRLTYELEADGTLKNVFLIAAPGLEFKVYVQGILKKKR